MSEEIVIGKGLSLKETYEELLPQVEALLESSEPVISNLSNFVAAIFNTFEKISWAGFYLEKGGNLFLGPFQGNTACTVIKIGEGVCGTAAAEKETVIVENVAEFPGHIYCDANTKSEIVIPVVYGNELFGVLDLDSYEYSAFNKTDAEYLERLVNILTKKVNLNKQKLV